MSVFQQESRNESMVVTLSDSEIRTKAATSQLKLGQRCHVGYPFLQEAKVVRVSDELFDYTLDEQGRAAQKHHTPKEIEQWMSKASRIETFYSKRLGILIGSVESMVHVHMLKGLIKTDTGASVKEYGEIPGMETDYAAQVIVDEVVNETSASSSGRPSRSKRSSPPERTPSIWGTLPSDGRSRSSAMRTTGSSVGFSS